MTYAPTYTSRDTACIWANLILAPAMWILSSLNMFVPSARSAAEFSGMSQNLLVPFGAAFAIWLPIFVGCIAYGVVQFLPQNRRRDIFRATGGWTASGFAAICGWALISAFMPAALVQWGTALVFIPATLCLVKAMVVLARGKAALSTAEHLTVHLPVSLIAGWTSIAIFLNWVPIAADATVNMLSLELVSLLVLALALAWAIFVLRKGARNWAYAFPILWGLGFLALKRLVTEPGAEVIGYAALGGIVVITVSTFTAKRRISA